MKSAIYTAALVFFAFHSAPASAFELESSSKGPCQVEWGVKAQSGSYQKFANWVEAAKPEVGPQDDEEAARAALCGELEQKDEAIRCMRLDLNEMHLYIQDEGGPVYYFNGMEARSRETGHTIAAFEPLSAEFFTLGVSQYINDLDEKGDDKGWTNVGFFDGTQGMWLVRVSRSVDGDNFDLEKGIVSGRACGQYFSAPIADLRAGKKPSAGAQKGAAKDTAKAKKEAARGDQLTIQKNYGEAIAAFETAIAADDSYAQGHAGLGYAALLADNLDRAEPALKKALTLEAPDKFKGAVWFNLGMLAQKRGDKAAARQAYQKADELRPSEAAKNRLKALDD